MGDPVLSWLDQYFGPAIVKLASVFLPRRSILEFIAGTGVTITAVDSSADKATKVTISAPGDVGGRPVGSNGQILTSDGADGFGTPITPPAGALVGTTATQTLTNKTINASNNTLSNIADAHVSASAAIAGAKISPN